MFQNIKWKMLKKNITLNDRKGYSLLEVLVAVCVGLIAISLISQSFIAEQRLIVRSTNGSEINSQLKLALRTMAKNIRMSGYGAGVRLAGGASASAPFDDYSNILNAGMSSIKASNNGGYFYNGVSEITGSDQIFITYRDPSKEFIMDTPYMSSYQDPKIASCVTTMLYAANATLSYPPFSTLPAGGVLVLPSKGYLACSNDSTQKNYIWQMNRGDQVPGGFYLPLLAGTPSDRSINVIQHTNQPNDNSLFAQNCCPSKVSKGGGCSETDKIPGSNLTCGPLVQVGFYLGKDGIDPTKTNLYMDVLDFGQTQDFNSQNASNVLNLNHDDTNMNREIVLAKNIEDLRFEYCVISNNGCNTPAQDPADWNTAYNNCLDPNNTTNWCNANNTYIDGFPKELIPYIAAVRITLTGKSEKADINSKYKYTSIQDNLDGTGSPNMEDGYVRSVETTVVQLPNFGYSLKYTVATSSP